MIQSTTQRRAAGPAAPADDCRSIGSLLRDLTDESRTLLRQEVELAKTEMGEKVSRIGRNIAYLAVGGLIAYAALLTLIFAGVVGLVQALSRVMPLEIASWLGPLIVGVIVGVIGYVLIQKAISTLKNQSLTPDKTLESLREDTQWLKERMK